MTRRDARPATTVKSPKLPPGQTPPIVYRRERVGRVSVVTPEDARIERRSESAGRRRRVQAEAQAEHYRGQVDMLRGKKFGLRTRRFNDRVMPVENTHLGKPHEPPEELPTAIAERRYKGTNQSISDSTYTNLNLGGVSFDTSTAGYEQIYDTVTDVWTIPPGLAGIWLVTGVTQFEGQAGAVGRRIVRILLNGATTIYSYVLDSTDSATSLPFVMLRQFDESDYFETQAWQNSGGSLNLLGGEDSIFIAVQYMGRGGNTSV